ncbi:MAG: hypothetical protein ACLU80_10645 [Dorea sp.]
MVSQENKKHEFQILAHTDSLTGIYNQPAMDSDELGEQMITKNSEAKFVPLLPLIS